MQNPFSLQPGNRKNAFTLITMVLAVGLVVLFEAMRWSETRLLMGLAVLGFSHVTHAGGNVLSKRWGAPVPAEKPSSSTAPPE